MKLNVDCIRAVLLEIEKIPYGQNLRPKTLYSSVETFAEEDINYSIIKLKEAGFIDAVIVESDDGFIFRFLVNDITWDGHQFLNNVREASVWEKAKEKCRKIGSLSIPILSDAASAILSSLITSQF